MCTLLLLPCLQHHLNAVISIPISRPEPISGLEPILTVASVPVLWGMESFSYLKAGIGSPRMGPWFRVHGEAFSIFPCSSLGPAYFFYVPILMTLAWAVLPVPLDPALESSLLSICLSSIGCKCCWESMGSILPCQKQIP